MAIWFEPNPDNAWQGILHFTEEDVKYVYEADLSMFHVCLERDVFRTLWAWLMADV